MFKIFVQPMKLCRMHPRGLNFLPSVRELGSKFFSFFVFGEKEKESILLGILFLKWQLTNLCNLLDFLHLLDQLWVH